MIIADLKAFAVENNITMADQKVIAQVAAKNIAAKYSYKPEQIKEHFDSLLYETEKETYSIYLDFQKQYGEKVFRELADHLIQTGKLSDISQVGDILADHFTTFDRFFLSLAQSRKARAGSSFEAIHNALFKQLKYPFDEQKVINGKPDFIMPSYTHFKKNPIDCIIFTAKRTLRERWRQIVTEGTRGLGFFLATIDANISPAQLAEMHRSRIYIVCPQSIKETKYSDRINVLSFTQFFKDYLDPAMERWRRNRVI